MTVVCFIIEYVLSPCDQSTQYKSYHMTLVCFIIEYGLSPCNQSTQYRCAFSWQQVCG